MRFKVKDGFPTARWTTADGRVYEVLVMNMEFSRNRAFVRGKWGIEWAPIDELDFTPNNFVDNQDS